MALHVILHEPAIPTNTGNIIRTTACVGASLHLVEPLGFHMDEPRLRRAGLDYHDLAHVEIHPDLDSALLACGIISKAPHTAEQTQLVAFSGHSSTYFHQIPYAENVALLMGTEPTGLPEEVMRDPRIDNLVRIPMRPGLRSLNLANATALALYHAWSTQGYIGGV